jgi:hypothetical protein
LAPKSFGTETNFGLEMNLGIEFEQSVSCRRFDPSAFDLPGGSALMAW